MLNISEKMTQTNEELGKKKYEELIKESPGLFVERSQDFINGMKECHELDYKYGIFALCHSIKNSKNNFLPLELNKPATLSNPGLVLLNSAFSIHSRFYRELLAFELWPLNLRKRLAKEFDDNKEDPYIKHILEETKKDNIQLPFLMQDPKQENSRWDCKKIFDKSPYLINRYESCIHTFKNLPIVRKNLQENEKFTTKAWEELCDDLKLNILTFFSIDELCIFRQVNKKEFTNLCAQALKISKPSTTAKNHLSTSIFPNVDMLCPTSLSATMYELFRFNRKLELQIQCCDEKDEQVYILAVAIFKLYNLTMNLNRNKFMGFAWKNLLKENVSHMGDLYDVYEDLRQRLLNEIKAPTQSTLLFKDVVKELCEEIKNYKNDYRGYSSKLNAYIEPDMEIKDRQAVIRQLNKCYNNLATHIENHMKKDSQQQTKCLVM